MSQYDELLSYIQNTLHCVPEKNNSRILFRNDGGKAFAKLELRRTALHGSNTPTPILTLSFRCDPLLSGSLRLQEGFSKAITDDWVTVLLNNTFSTEMLQTFLAFAAEQSSNHTTSSPSSKNRDWLIPANPKYFDLFAAFQKNDTILWKQSSKVAVGDIIYLYVAAPYSAILFRCRAVEVDIPYTKKNSRRHITTAMRIQLLYAYDQQTFCLDTLKEYGVTTVRGPRGVPYALKHLLEKESNSPIQSN